MKYVFLLFLSLVCCENINAQGWKQNRNQSSIGNYIRSLPKSQGKPKDKYATGEIFNPGGYRISSGNRYRDVYLKKFPDNDTLYCLQYPDQRGDGRIFHFLIISSRLKDKILENTLNKKHAIADRINWMVRFLTETGIDNITNMDSPWTKCKTVSDGSIMYGNYYQAGYTPLTYKKAVQAYKDQRNITAQDILAAMFIYNWLSKSDDPHRNEDEYNRQQQEYHKYLEEREMRRNQ